MAYIGKGFKDIATANIAVNTMVGDGSDTTLGLSMGSKGVGSVNDVSVFVGGIQQRPGTDFTLSGSTITFTTAPADGVKVVAMSHGDSWNNAPSDNTITPAKLKDASVTSDKIIGLDAGKLSGSLSGSGVNLTNLNAANISGTLPAIDGSALTGISAYENETSDPTATSNKTLGTMWVNKTSGEMYILTDDTTNANVWTNVGGGTGDMPFTGMVATGGVVPGGTIVDGDYKYHVFNNSSDGPFVVTTAGDTPEVEYLVIAGGGGTGGRGGGGGAGGYLTATGFSVTASSYPITVGAGGAGGSGGGGGAVHGGTNGTDSVFSTITATGGGHGGSGTLSAADGGSGGGGDNAVVPGGSGTSGQGNDGGDGLSTANYGSGGGGGAGAVGEDGTSAVGGDGGVGLSSSITGSVVYRSGGGGGGMNGSTASSGGNGGGGQGGPTTGTAGTANTGGGAGGGSYNGAHQAGAAGGSGIVIIRYKFQ